MTNQKNLESIFTELMRKKDSRCWGNWAGDDDAHIGAVGYIDPDTHAFTKCGTVKALNDAVTSKGFHEHLDISSLEVSRHDADANGNGPITDQTVKMKSTWKFKNGFTIAASCCMKKQSSLDNVATLLVKCYKDIKKLADTEHWTSDGDIVQGFGVITHAYTAESGVLLTAQAESVQCSISGDVEPLQKFLGLVPGGHGKYESLDAIGSVVEDVWIKANEEAGDKKGTERTIYYRFASFRKGTPMQDWTGVKGDLQLVFRNHASYDVKYKVTFISEGESTDRKDVLSVGLNYMVQLPGDADNIQLEIYIDDKLFGPYKIPPTHFGADGRLAVYCQGIPLVQAPAVTLGNPPPDWIGSAYQLPPAQSQVEQLMEKDKLVEKVNRYRE